MTWVDRGEASLLALDAGEVYVAGRYHSLVPIAQEVCFFYYYHMLYCMLLKITKIC